MSDDPQVRVRRLLHFTDLHLYGDRRRRLRGVNTSHSLRAVLDVAHASHWPPDAVLLGGDLVHDESRRGYQHLRTHFERDKVPVYSIPGNHDDPALMREMLDDAPFQYGGIALLDPWCVILLDSHVPGEDGGRLGEAALAALDEVLDEHRDRWALLCLHHHPVAIGSRWLDELGLADADAFLALIECWPQVRGVLWGHIHQAFDAQRGQLRLLSTPSTCAQFMPGTDRFQPDTRPPAFRRLDLREDGRIVTEVVWIDTQ